MKKGFVIFQTENNKWNIAPADSEKDGAAIANGQTEVFFQSPEELKTAAAKYPHMFDDQIAELWRTTLTDEETND